MKVSIVGTGYVGLVTGVCLAEKGHHVVCADVDAAKVAAICAGSAPFYEPDLERLLHRHMGGRFRATTDLRQAVAGSDLTLIAVGTPLNSDSIDLSYVRQAAADVGAALRDKSAYHVVVVKSTVVPGTTDGVVRPALEEASRRRVGDSLGLGMNPEFLSEGQAVADFLEPDRIVIGGSDARTVESIRSLYAGFENVPVVQTTNKTAEMIKYASNSVLATLISYSNEIGNLCAALGGIDVVDVFRGVHLSHYFSLGQADGQRLTAPIAAFLAAGCGFGGSCLPKDVQALIRHGEQTGESMDLLKAVIGINQQQPERMMELLRRHYPDLRGVRAAVLGLAFKPGTDDVRLSPAIPIVKTLLAQGARVKAYDPKANASAARVIADPRLAYCESLAEAVDDVEAILLVTRWDEFRRLPELLHGQAKPPVVIDGRRMFERSALSRYEGIGVALSP
jgi:UDPglucose 6-dehydrogenase/GDP-mannose 6-dehydrogenase